jgi:hypothetical protein
MTKFSDIPSEIIDEYIMKSNPEVHVNLSKASKHFYKIGIKEQPCQFILNLYKYQSPNIAKNAIDELNLTSYKPNYDNVHIIAVRRNTYR